MVCILNSNWLASYPKLDQFLHDSFRTNTCW
jgi:hypothetical protein